MSRLFGLMAAAMLIAHSALAYTLTETPQGQAVRWRYGQKFYLTGNPKGQDGISADFFYQSVVHALQQWKWASAAQLDFEYWQGTDAKIYEPSLSENGLNSIFFASNSKEISDPNIIGFTQVWYDNDTGNLIETDVMLNDRNYQLTENEADTSASTPFNYGQRPKVYLGNIITHELGHAIGLSHSGNINSSMLYVEYPEQSKLGCDDRAGIRQLYAASDGTTGSLRGTVLSPEGQPIAGAVISAISKERGVVLASVMSDQNGNYYFGALDTGETGLVIQTFQGSNHSIPASVQTHAQVLCGGDYFPTHFVTDSGNHALRRFQIEAGKLSDAGSEQVLCHEVTAQTTAELNGVSPELVVDVGRAGQTRTYAFESHGAFSLSGLSYLFLSSVKVDLQVSDASGNPVTVQKEAPIYQANSQFKLPDTRVSGYAQGLIYVRVTASALQNSDFPSPAVYSLGVPYYVLAFHSSGEPSLFSDARCSAPESFALYRSPASEPIRNAATTTSRDGIGFCGGNAQAASLQDHSRHFKRPTPAGSILGWFFPFFVATLSWLYSKRRQAKLKSR